MVGGVCCDGSSPGLIWRFGLFTCLFIPDLKLKSQWLCGSGCSHHRSQGLKRNGSSQWLSKTLLGIFSPWLTSVDPGQKKSKVTNRAENSKEQPTFYKQHNLLPWTMVDSTTSKMRHTYTPDSFLLPTDQAASHRVCIITKSVCIQSLPLFRPGSSTYNTWKLG